MVPWFANHLSSVILNLTKIVNYLSHILADLSNSKLLSPSDLQSRAVRPDVMVRLSGEATVYQLPPAINWSQIALSLQSFSTMLRFHFTLAECQLQ